MRSVSWRSGGPPREPTMPKSALLGLAVFGLVIGQVAAAAGQVAPGGGSADTDCLVTYDSIPAPVPASKPTHVQCADQDASCDGDPNRLGYCRFQLQVSFNSTGFAGCSPANLPAGGFLIPFSGAANDDHPKHIADFEVFQQFAQDSLPLTAVKTNVMSGFSDVTIPLTITFASSGPKFKKTTVTMQPTMCTNALILGKCESGLKDKDKFKLNCTPAIDGMTGKPVSPCTGISGTFQQMQEHIFDRKCSAQASCHGSPTSFHDLCLAPSCSAGTRSAYTDLVGITPHNSAALMDGLKRVDPGIPANSLLIHKILGELDSPNFGPDQYGKRMPYNDPAHDRARKKLSSGEVQLISDWITAGAPATGFVSTSAKGACH